MDYKIPVYLQLAKDRLAHLEVRYKYLVSSNNIKSASLIAEDGLALAFEINSIREGREKPLFADLASKFFKKI